MTKSGDIRKMLEYLYYYCGGFFGPNERLIIKRQNESFELDYCRYYQEYVENGVPHFRAVWSEIKLKPWLAKLESLDLDRWKEEYWADACDGEQWELRYKFENADERIINGSNAYPDNWEPFQKLMKGIARKIPRVGFMSIEQSARLFYPDDEFE